MESVPTNNENEWVQVAEADGAKMQEAPAQELGDKEPDHVQ